MIVQQQNETPEGIRLLYDLLVKASEYPGESPHNPRNLYSWGEKLKALHHLISRYHDEEYLNEYSRVGDLMKAASAHYPTSRYVTDGYASLFEWLGAISRLYSRLGLMIPESLTYSEEA